MRTPSYQPIAQASKTRGYIIAGWAAEYQTAGGEPVVSAKHVGFSTSHPMDVTLGKSASMPTGVWGAVVKNAAGVALQY